MADDKPMVNPAEIAAELLHYACRATSRGTDRGRAELLGARVIEAQQDEIERLNDLVARLNDDLWYYRTVINNWVDADNAREGHTADCYEHGACGVEMCAQENGLRLAVLR